MHSTYGLVRQQITVALSERISYLAECDPAYLAERPELGPINFQSGKDLFRRAVELGKDVQGLSLELIPQRTHEQLYEVLEDLVQGLRRIELFTPLGDSATEQRDTLLYDAESQYERAFNLIAPYLAYLQLKSAQAHESTYKSAELLQQSIQRIAINIEELNTKLAALDRTLDGRRDDVPEQPRHTPGVFPAPVIHGYTESEASQSWVWALVFASVFIAGLILLGTSIYNWFNYW